MKKILLAALALAAFLLAFAPLESASAAADTSVETTASTPKVAPGVIEQMRRDQQTEGDALEKSRADYARITEGDQDSMTNLDVDTLTLVVAVLIPLLTGVVTKYVASRGVKALCTLVLAIAASAVQVLIDHDGKVIASEWLNTTIVTYVIAIAGYYGLLKPTAIAETVQRWTYNVGIGGNGPDPAVETEPNFSRYPDEE